MGLFGKKRPKVVDWTEKMRAQQERVNSMREEISSSSNYENYPRQNTENVSEENATPFPFFANQNTGTSSNETPSEGLSPEERRRRLGKRLLDMTEKIEDISNQIYKLEQRIETLERRNPGPSY